MGAEPAELAVGQGGGQQTPRQVGVGGVCVCVGGGGGEEGFGHIMMLPGT